MSKKPAKRQIGRLNNIQKRQQKRSDRMKEVKLRRYQNLLTLSGLGVIVFGLWSILKVFLILLLNDDTFSEMIEAAEVPDNSVTRLILYLLLAVLPLIDFSMRLFVGLSARSESFGKKRGCAYIVFAALIVLSSLISVVFIFFDTPLTNISSVLELVVSVFVEATATVVMIELLVSAITVKKLNKELGEVR